MSDLTDTPTADTTPVCAGQLELFRLPCPRVVISYARPDGGALTGEDFDHLARLARAGRGLNGVPVSMPRPTVPTTSPAHERPTTPCR